MIEVTKPRAIALGYFDGVHLGHRALMQKAVERAKQIGGTSAVFTFDVHPDSVVMGRQVPLLTMPAGSSPAATTALATRVRATPRAWRSSARRPVSATTASRTSR